jgi:tRNA(Ile)-lysidine synthase TilS/MesJ
MDDLTTFWLSHKELWFNSVPETDKIVVDNTKQYFNNHALVKTLSILGQIIFYDQITRHYVRYNKHLEQQNQPTQKTNIEYNEIEQTIIDESNSIAITLTNQMLESNQIDALSPIEKCFCIMPLRHSKNEDDRIKAIRIIELYLEKEPNNTNYLRFYQASLERVRNPILTVRTEKFPQHLVCSSSSFLDTSESPQNYYSSFNFEDPILKEELNDFTKGFNEAIPDKSSEIVISISGGSDSMLCLFIATKLGYKTKALMIDYCNRQEHDEEVILVSWFCQQLGVELYVRPIKELKRERDGTREFYETVTRNIRFNSYKFLGLPVVLGHNRDDCFENCITNIMTLRSKDNLFGMKPISDQYGVSIRRPVLDIPKSRIVMLCNRFNIPFLLDSTPKWSRRGRIRDIVVPSLNEFDDNLIPRIMQFCQETSESIRDYQTLLENFPITSSEYTTRTKKQKQVGFTIPYSSEQKLNTNVRFWQGMINRVIALIKTENPEIIPIRISTITSMVTNIEKEINNQNNTREIQVSLSPQIRAFINEARTFVNFRIM